ncbi:hypothetical protein KC207_12325 [Phycicoccus sp. BSK3Z-2]|uniref:PepSY domain-containing protein n=1 Tax=Phycicoccus avicenniae TaxID=2828860 RepID=A0A941D9L3_9MICO|nr:hypothetical protein [Phycicoccus avicenniae]MBR7744076.1 hypothetical protein [Phycicoccus avicenniae]
MDRTRTILAVGGAGLAAAVALGLTGAGIAAADDSTSTPSPSATASPEGGTTDGDGERPDRPMMDEGGPLTADAASRAIAAAEAEVDGGTATAVRARSDGTYDVMLTTDDGHVHVALDADFAVTGTHEGGGPVGRGPGRGGPGMGHGPGADRDRDEGSTDSGDPSDANGTSDDTAAESTAWSI